MATAKVSSTLLPRQLCLPGGKTLPPSIPLIISSQDNWNPLSCQLETQKQDPNNHSLRVVEDALDLIRSIDKPLAILSICGPYRSGKSYFISRVLGSPGAFKLGHSMKACTRGIWMATTVLECEHFATILLDTEGIDAVGVSETFSMSLLTLTTLLSSFLIYNSKKVPQKLDLSKMKCFTRLSASLLTQRKELLSTEEMKGVFPHFLWLLQDVCLKMTDRAGKEITPTKFIHTRILRSETGELTDLGKSLVHFFPSVECATLPIPSTKRDVIRNIVQQPENLKPEFNTAVESLIQHILQKVSPKKAIDGETLVNGSSIAALACQYVEAINQPGAVPNLDEGWQAVVRLELKEYSHQLQMEYRTEMEKALKGKLPMEESSLMSLHQQIFQTKKSKFQKQINSTAPLQSSEEHIIPYLDDFEKAVVQWGAKSRTEVIGGVLFQFTAENYTSSKHHCNRVFRDLVKESRIEEQVTHAIQNSVPLDIGEQIAAVTNEYQKKAVGPAAAEVMERGKTEFKQLQETLKMIPGTPQNVTTVGRSADRIKLTWKPPHHNPEAVEFYIVSKRIKEGEWEKVMHTEETKALITGLRSNTEYEFKIQATNALVSSEEDDAKGKTLQTKVEAACKGAAFSSYKLPVFTNMCVYATNPKRPFTTLPFTVTLNPQTHKLETQKTVVRATLPVSILISPLSAPVGAIIAAKLTATSKGDVAED